MRIGNSTQLAILLLTSDVVNAAGVGEVAEHVLEPASVVTNFLLTGCIILGIAFIFTAIIRYNLYRTNPLANPISTVVFFLVAGIILLCFPLASRFFEQAPNHPPSFLTNPPNATSTS